MNALRLQVETYRKIENQENINEEELANVIMDRGYTESLLDAISDDYSVSRLDEGQPPPTPPYQGGESPRLNKEGARGWFSTKR